MLLCTQDFPIKFYTDITDTSIKNITVAFSTSLNFINMHRSVYIVLKYCHLSIRSTDYYGDIFFKINFYTKLLKQFVYCTLKLLHVVSWLFCSFRFKCNGKILFTYI